MPLTADDIEQIGRLMDDRMERCAYNGSQRAIKLHIETCEARKTLKRCKQFTGAALVVAVGLGVKALWNWIVGPN